MVQALGQHERLMNALLAAPGNILSVFAIAKVAYSTSKSDPYAAVKMTIANTQMWLRRQKDGPYHGFRISKADLETRRSMHKLPGGDAYMLMKKEDYQKNSDAVRKPPVKKETSPSAIPVKRATAIEPVENETDLGWFILKRNRFKFEISGDKGASEITREQIDILKILYWANGEPVSIREFPVNSVVLLKAIKDIRKALGDADDKWREVVSPGVLSATYKMLPKLPEAPQPDASLLKSKLAGGPG